MSDEDRIVLEPGWYVQLLGDKTDLEDWVYTFNEPFDPVAMKDADGTVFLKSSEFEAAETAQEVREKGLALVARMNGAIALMHSARPVKLGGIIRADAEGRRHAHVFAEMAALEFGRCTARVTAVVLGPDGKPVPPPPPQPSTAQEWNSLATQDDDCADLLEQLGKADGWYEIYKAIEVAEHIAGGKHKLGQMLSDSRADCERMRRTANYYRHARAPRPETLATLSEAKSLLHFMVRTVLEKRQAQPEQTH
ncbi:MAG: hypothetical protein ACR2JJ_04705 [Sphingomicrobium sp.]